MAIVPSWQQLPPQHAAIQQPLLPEAAEWGRPLLVDSATILQEPRPVFPVDVTTEVYNPALVETTSSWNGSKRSSKNHHMQQSNSHHNHHHLMVPAHHRSQHDKKEQTQLSPVKKRVKEGTPPSEQLNYGNSGRRNHNSPSMNGHWQHNSHNQVTQDHHTQTHHGRQHTITINDTPSPAVSVITISDSEDEATPGKTNRNVQTNTTQPIVNRKNVISCVSVPDSDNEDRSSSKV